jgi:SAM-dependent methyltransferase
MTEENPYRSANAWGDEVATRWLAYDAALDRALAPFGEAALEGAGAAAGERAIDVGCGTGATTVALAESVGASGHVLGVDVAAALLERARQRAGDRPQVELRLADAQTIRLRRDREVVFSRFGVMFFPDPVQAFRNLSGALLPGGRLTFVCWRRFQDNPWKHIPFEALQSALPAIPPPPAVGPGPYAFADPGQLRRVLAACELSDVIDVTIDRFDCPVTLGEDLTTAVDFSMNTGPIGRALAGLGQGPRDHARHTITRALARHLSGQGVILNGSAWVVNARVEWHR